MFPIVFKQDGQGRLCPGSWFKFDAKRPASGRRKLSPELKGSRWDGQLWKLGALRQGTEPVGVFSRLLVLLVRWLQCEAILPWILLFVNTVKKIIVCDFAEPKIFLECVLAKVLGCAQLLCITPAASSHSPEWEVGHVRVVQVRDLQSVRNVPVAQGAVVQLLATPWPAQMGRLRYWIKWTQPGQFHPRPFSLIPWCTMVGAVGQDCASSWEQEFCVPGCSIQPLLNIKSYKHQ